MEIPWLCQPGHQVGWLYSHCCPPVLIPQTHLQPWSRLSGASPPSQTPFPGNYADLLLQPSSFTPCLSLSNQQTEELYTWTLARQASMGSRQTSLSFLFLIYNFPDSLPALHQTASRGLFFLSSSTPWGPHRFSWQNFPPSYGPSQPLPSSLTLFIPVSFQSLELCSTWDHKWPFWAGA